MTYEPNVPESHPPQRKAFLLTNPEKEQDKSDMLDSAPMGKENKQLDAKHYEHAHPHTDSKTSVEEAFGKPAC